MDKGTQNPKVKILLDADLIIHFYKADKIFDLPNIFNDSELVLFDLVWEELNRTALKFAIEHMLKKLESFGTILSQNFTFKTVHLIEVWILVIVSIQVNTCWIKKLESKKSNNTLD